MLKKKFYVPVGGLGVIVLFSWLCLHFGGSPKTPLKLLGGLSLVSIVAVAVFFLAASVTYRSNGVSGGIGALSTLIMTLGATVIAFTLAAALLGVGLAITYGGIAVIAALATVAMASLSKDER